MKIHRGNHTSIEVRWFLSKTLPDIVDKSHPVPHFSLSEFCTTKGLDFKYKLKIFFLATRWTFLQWIKYLVQDI